jgi:Na+-driven multidrug efflux pump
MAKDALLSLGLATIPDSVTYALGGALRGVGKQIACIAVIGGTTIVIFLPLAYYFTFVCAMGIAGLWYAQLVKCVFSIFLFHYILWHKTDWQ